MAVTCHFPADLLDLARCAGARTPLMWAVAREMHGDNPTWAFRAGDRTVAVLGLYPLGDGTAEAWFSPRPEAAAHMTVIVRRARLTLTRLSYRETVTICGSQAGRRIARLLGFSFTRDTDLGELWTWEFSEAKAALISARRSRRSSAGNSPR